MEVSVLEDTEDVKSVLLWIQRVEAQRVQKTTVNNIKEAKEFNSVRHSSPKDDNDAQKKQE